MNAGDGREPGVVWAGVDVGGRRKGFHAAVIDGPQLLAGPERLPEPHNVVSWLLKWKPVVVAVDSPRSPAPDGQQSREGERRLAREICGIRYTPDKKALDGNRVYYEWIEHGFKLYGALEAAEFKAIECFPTASWTRWAGRRLKESRSRWSHKALLGLRLKNLPVRLNQDDRDAIAAAKTSYLYDKGYFECFGAIVVPQRSDNLKIGRVAYPTLT